MDDFGPWLTYKEAIKSQTATRRGIANVPTDEEYENMKLVYKYVYAKICDHFRRKIPVSSFFRSEALNKAVGGSKTSSHRFGQAIDLDCDGATLGLTNRALFDWIRKNISFDQLLLEHPDDAGEPGWVHIGYVSDKENRQQVLVAKKVGGKTIYQPF